MSTAQAAEPSGRARGADALRRWTDVLRFRELALIPVIAIAVVVGTIVNDAFLTERNILNILQQSSEMSIVVLAEAIILIVGRFDLSLESVVSVAPMFAAWLVSAEAIGGSGLDVNPYLSLVILLAVGVLVGLFNGFMVVRLKLNAFIVTLAMLILLKGVTIGLANGRTLFDLPEPLLYLGNAEWLGVPVSVWLAGLLYLIAGGLLKYHSFGRAIYAIGGNPAAARAAGIRVDRVVWIVFVIGGGLAALAGLMLTGRLASVTSAQGNNIIFTVFAAAVIGGISLNGGRGRMLGALTGVLLLGIISNILTLSRIESYWIDASYGAVILIALVLARVTSGEAQEE